MQQFQNHIVAVAEKKISLELTFSCVFHILIKYCFILFFNTEVSFKIVCVPIWLSSILKKMFCSHKCACQPESSVAVTESKKSMFDVSQCFQKKFHLTSKRIPWFTLFSASVHLFSCYHIYFSVLSSQDNFLLYILCIKCETLVLLKCCSINFEPEVQVFQV